MNLNCNALLLWWMWIWKLTCITAPTKAAFLHTSRTVVLRRTLATISMEESADIEVNIRDNLLDVRDRMERSCIGRSVDNVRLVAVSKTKPLSFIKEAYANGQRIFGENYVQELEEKAKSIEESDIVWHFIGGLQSNKASKLLKNVLPHGKLVVETVGSAKVANKLNNAMANFDFAVPLDVFVQVNTSDEESKNGVSVEEAVTLCKHIVDSCELLKLKGIMTIGAKLDSSCFDKLADCRQSVADALLVDPIEIELSMGMSGDFEKAIAKGSTNIRVGSTIFGQRDYTK